METKSHKYILWITQTALLMALLVVLQGTTGSLGQLVTGSCVNAVLAISVMLAGPYTGIVVAVLSPVCAFLFGIGPQLPALLPAIAAGNLTYVLVIHFLTTTGTCPVWWRAVSIISGALLKFIALYLLVVKLLCSVLPLKPPQIEKFSTMFSLPQLFTALIGGGVALVVYLLVNPALKKLKK